MSQHNYEAHLQHELNRFKGDSLKEAIEEEISALFEWFDEISLDDLITEDQITDFIDRNIIKAEIKDETVEYLTENLKAIFSYLEKNDSKIENLVSKDQYDKVVEDLIKLDGIRQELTSTFISSSVYTKLISDVLYNGIKDFMLSENALTKKIPGAASLLKVGQGLMSIAAPKLEESIDKKLLQFINKNIQATVRHSETFLNKALDKELLTQDRKSVV